MWPRILERIQCPPEGCAPECKKPRRMACGQTRGSQYRCQICDPLQRCQSCCTLEKPELLQAVHTRFISTRSLRCSDRCVHPTKQTRPHPYAAAAWTSFTYPLNKISTQTYGSQCCEWHRQGQRHTEPSARLPNPCGLEEKDA